MPIEIGRAHGNGYHDSIYRKVTMTKNCSECTNEKVMQGRIDNNLIIKVCPTTCDCFELCVAKSGEVSLP